MAGSGIFAGGWGAKRAAVYGVEEKDLGKFYAQRTLLKREVLPEHCAQAVFVLCSPELSRTDRPARPRRLRRRGSLPGMTAGGFAAVDLGASSGRVMVGEVGPDMLRLTAAARFPNDPVRIDDGLHWDVEALVEHAITGLATAYAAGPLTSIESTRGASTTDGCGTVG